MPPLFLKKGDNIMIDISNKITNKLPELKITEELVIVINNRKSNIFRMQEYFKNKKNVTKTENEIKHDILEILIPKKSLEAIDEMDLPISEFNEIYETVIAVATGSYGKDKTPSKK